MASNAHSTAYKRLGKTVDLTGKTSGELTFKFSSDLEEAWDFMMVEAHVLDDDADPSVAMSYWTEDDLPFYYGLARAFPLADHWFSS